MNLLTLLSAGLQPVCLVCEGPVARRSEKICSWCTLPPIHSSRNLCVQCGSPLTESTTCGACELFPLPFRQVRSLWDYNHRVAEAIRKMKYHHIEPLCHIFSHILSHHVGELFFLRDWDLILAIPTHRKRFASRGFHPPEIFASSIRKKLNHTARQPPLGALKVASIHPPQASREQHERYELLQDGFSANPNKVRGKRVLLVDDVLTSGATLCSAAFALNGAEAKSIDGITLARSIHWSESRAELWKHSNL